MTTVLIYRSIYGQLSETFVRDHVHGLRRYQPLVLANRVDPKGPPETTEIIVIPNHGRVRGIIWRRGWSRRLHSLIQTRRPALIHAHFLMDGAAIVPFARRYGIPLVVTAHGYDATTYPHVQAQSSEGRLLLARQQIMATYATRILCVSDYIREELISRGYPADRLITQPLGVDIAALGAIPDAARSGILAVGRLVEKKGTSFLIEAYAKLPHAIRAAHPLTIIGDGPLRGALQAQANSLRIAVKFVGGQAHERVIAEQARAAVFCFPSVRAASGDAEGMGIAVMEALALRTPVVLFDEQPAAPILNQHGAGIVARARDAADLARALEKVLADKVLAQSLGMRGRVLCQSTFDINRTNRIIEDIYAEVAAFDGGG